MTQGSAKIFSLMASSSQLKCTEIKERDKTSLDLPLPSFIDNTNLHSLPSNCTGVLVAYRLRIKGPHNLGIILFLHPRCTLIVPCHAEIIIPDTCNYVLSGVEKIETISINEKTFLYIDYLNRITKRTRSKQDGFIESSTDGPDCIMSFQQFPKEYQIVIK